MATFLPSRNSKPFLGLRRRPGVPVVPFVAPDDAPLAPHTRRSSVVAAAIYHDGRRTGSFTRLAEAFRTLRERPGGMAWIGLERPDETELMTLAREFDLHPLAVEDAIQAHQRPKIERYGDTLFVVLRAAKYLDAEEQLEFGELHVFVGPDFVVTVRHGASPDLAGVRGRLEREPQMLSQGPEAVLYAILDAVVDGYAPVVAGLENDVDEIESEVFGGDPEVSRRIYELSREVVDFQRAVRPLQGVCASLAKGAAKYGVDEELQAYLRDVADHLTEAGERIESYRAALRDILTVNATLVAQRQNEEMKHLSEVSIQQGEEVKKISGWAAILFAPTLVGTVYGMNFDTMPELHTQYGYPAALVAMLGVSVGLFRIFRWKRWI
ncbi:magnesium and cobalt transport protein CorA [Antribacter sp. KLBMP9083]|uniref:Magnesium and cobalt transport protein CorA n=1 Tax=Antribacter soli TaxID=2910976 RepID=A0AA41UAM3_9MICO|nr:magnesium and cobalt transport protein CorA [Antribacter soli]MCF4120269.1 magnesium and cobalt transport protein CorA [Antribacter soli]